MLPENDSLSREEMDKKESTVEEFGSVVEASLVMGHGTYTGTIAPATDELTNPDEPAKAS